MELTTYKIKSCAENNLREQFRHDFHGSPDTFRDCGR